MGLSLKGPEGWRTQRAGGPRGLEDPEGWRTQRDGGPRGPSSRINEC